MQHKFFLKSIARKFDFSESAGFTFAQIGEKDHWLIDCDENLESKPLQYKFQ